MLNKKNFADIKKELELRDVQREAMIKDSRKVLKLSKQIIYSVHRQDLKSAKGFVDEINAEVKKLEAIAEKSAELLYSGSFKAAMQEYVEAVVFYEFVANDKILSSKDLNVDPEFYLLGLCDLSGELVRLAVNSGTKGDLEKVAKIKDVLEQIYGLMLEFDFRNGELRKKFDSLKWDLNKIEGLVYDIKIKRS